MEATTGEYAKPALVGAPFLTTSLVLAIGLWLPPAVIAQTRRVASELTALPGGVALPVPSGAEILRMASYASGYDRGTAIRRDAAGRIAIDVDLATAGLRAALSGAKPAYSPDEMSVALRLVFGARASTAGQVDDRARVAQEFLSHNRAKSGVTTLPSGLQYRVITPGTGSKPGPRDTVVVRHRGTLIDGTEFAAGGTATVNVGSTMRGWNEALKLMAVGSKWEVVIPPHLGYGPVGQPPRIPPHAALVCEIELLETRAPEQVPENSPPPAVSGASPRRPVTPPRAPGPATQ